MGPIYLGSAVIPPRNHPPTPPTPTPHIASDLPLQRPLPHAALILPLGDARPDTHHPHNLALHDAADALNLVAVVPGAQLRRGRAVVVVPERVDRVEPAVLVVWRRRGAGRGRRGGGGAQKV